jgi:UDP-4-amino-4,6-dideoxy-N-acetyl-beta-L-altrosamine transaminase
MKPIPYGKQEITQQDIDAVVDVLQSDYLTQGPKVNEFENSFANFVEADYAIAVSNGTAALHLAVLALGLKKGDKVITTPLTFVASANCIRYCDAEVTFADIDPVTYLIDFNFVEKLVKSSPKGTYKGIIVVDFAGRSVNLEQFRALADAYGLWIIEDACHAPGAYFIDSNKQKQLTGNGKFADISVFSFHPVKHIACGEGGMLTTNNKILYNKLMSLRSHGITRNLAEFKNEISLADSNAIDYPLWYMEMQELGFNYRLTDIQAALGCSQLTRIEANLERRSEIAEIYYNAFKDESFVLGQSGIVEGHAYHLYILEVKDRFGLYNYLRQNNIFAQIHYFPVHLMPYYKSIGSDEGSFIYAEKYYKNCISLPVFQGLNFEDQNYIINSIMNFYAK